MPYPLRDKFNMPLAVCAGGRIRDSKRLLVDIGTRSQDACDALNQYDELVEALSEAIMIIDSIGIGDESAELKLVLAKCTG